MSEEYIQIVGVDGVNQAVRPDNIAPTQLAGAVNISLENGPKTRPLKFHERSVTVTTEGGVTARNGVYKSYQDIFNTGKFQMLADYYSDQGAQLLVVVAGIVFVVDINYYIASVISGQELNEYLHRYNWSPAGRYYVMYDSPQYPVILDGNDLKRSDPNKYQIPVSSIGTYNYFRVAVANDYNNFVIGDPDAAGFKEGPITFTEVFAPSAPRVDQFFSVGNRPFGEQITFMGNIQITDTSTGIGPLVVSTDTQIWTYRTDAPSSTWETMQNFGTLTISNHGIKGARAAVNVGFDFLYMSTEDDIRSLNTSRQQQATWANVSISEEVKEYLATSNKDLNKFTVAGYFKNRVFFMVNPYRVRSLDSGNNSIYDIAFKGLVVLETASQSGLAGVSPPKWVGVWTAPGISFQDMVRIDNRCFCWCKTTSGNKLVEMVEDSFDQLHGTQRAVTSRIYSHEFGSNTNYDKSITNVKAYIPQFDIKAGLTVTSFFKPSHASEYIKMNTVNYSSSTCELNTLPGAVKEVNLGGQGQLQYACDKAFNTSYSVFRSGQLMIEFTGEWAMDAVEVIMNIKGVSGTPVFKCDYDITSFNKRNCGFISDWELMGKKVG